MKPNDDTSLYTEETDYDTSLYTEETDYDDRKNAQNAIAEAPKAESANAAPPARGVWKKVALGASTGIVFGAATTILTGGAEPVAAEDNENGSQNEQSSAASGNPDLQPLILDDVATATGVTDDMSFSQAFATARAEVGAGGVFEWRGMLYGTYTAEEWDNLSAEEIAEYNDHFAWSAGSTAHSSSAEMQESHAGTLAAETDPAAETKPESPAFIDDNQPSRDNETITPALVSEIVSEQDIQVLGVEHDPEYNINVGALVIEGQEVVVVDVDNDAIFDVAASDLNGNGEIEENEMADISDVGLTVDHLTGMASSPYDPAQAIADEGQDYISDADYGG